METQGVGMQRLLSPGSIAIVGASQQENKLAGQLVPSLLRSGFAGAVYPVNPRYEQVGGLRCYGSVRELPGPVDHVVIAVNKSRARNVLSECVELGVGGASVFSSGYAEVDAKGAHEQNELVRAAAGIPFLGPNCMGFANLLDGVIATTSAVFQGRATSGGVALISQSGGLGFGTISFLSDQIGLGFTYAANIGNGVGVSLSELASYVSSPAETRCLLAVLESDELVAELVDAVACGLVPAPVILLKLGRSARGALMARSHTGALAGDFKVVGDIAESVGITCVRDVDEAVHVAMLLCAGVEPGPRSGLAALSISGGNVTLLADVFADAGLNFADLSTATVHALRQLLPSYVSVHNPVDITALGYEEPELHRAVLATLTDDPNVNMVVPIITTARDYTPVCGLLADTKPVLGADLVVLWAGGSYENRSLEMLRDAEIPVFRSGNLLARAIAALRRSAVEEEEAQRPTPPRPIVAAHDASTMRDRRQRSDLRESEVYALLSIHDVPLPRWEVVAPDEAKHAAARVGFPVVLKRDSADTGLSDKEGVLIDVRSETELKSRIGDLGVRGGDPVLVAEFLPGLELIASTYIDPHFGLTMMIGSGGRLAELVRDVRFLRLPATGQAIAKTLEDSFAGRALKQGFRGIAGFDEAVGCLVAVAAAACHLSESLVTLELNPITVGRRGAFVVDAAATVASNLNTGGLRDDAVLNSLRTPTRRKGP